MLPIALRVRMARLFNCGSCTIIGILFFLFMYFIAKVSEVVDHGHPEPMAGQIFSDNKTIEESHWHSVLFANNTPSNLILIYSAHHELDLDRDYESINVLGVVRKGVKFSNSLWCVLEDKSRSREYVIRPSFEVIPVHDGPNSSAYVPVMITCDLRDIRIFVNPTSVKIKHKDSTSDWIPAKSSVSPSKDPEVCVLPLQKDYKDVGHILEFVAYYIVNGINNFVFFDTGASKDVSNILQSFKSAKVQFNSLRVPRFMSQDISLTTLNAMVTHYCLQSLQSHPLVVVTINDLMAPRNDRLESYIAKKLSETDDVAALIVPMVLFCQENQNTFYTEVKDGFETSMVHQTKRQNSIFPHHIHSRVIVLRPNMVKFLGGHFTLEMNPRYDGKEEDTDSDEILLFNYKPCAGILNKKEIKENVVVDNRLELLRDEIVALVKSNSLD